MIIPVAWPFKFGTMVSSYVQAERFYIYPHFQRVGYHFEEDFINGPFR